MVFSKCPPGVHFSSDSDHLQASEKRIKIKKFMLYERIAFTSSIAFRCFPFILRGLTKTFTGEIQILKLAQELQFLQEMFLRKALTAKI